MVRRLNKNIFSLPIINSAVSAFAELAYISIDDSKDYWEVKFENCKHDMCITVNEFENYLIQLTFLGMKKSAES